MWPFKCKKLETTENKCERPEGIGSLRVVSWLEETGAVFYRVEELEWFSYSKQAIWLAVSNDKHPTKKEACERMRNMLRAREYGTKVEDCDCDGEE